MEKPLNHRSSNTQEGEHVPQGWDRAIPPTAGNTIPAPRGGEQAIDTDASDTYTLPQAEPQTVELQKGPETTQAERKKRFGLGAKIGAGLAGAAMVAGAGFMLGAKGRSDEIAAPDFSPTSVSAGEVPGPVSQAPASETATSKAEQDVQVVARGPHNEKITVDDLKELGHVSASEASTVPQANDAYLKRLATVANLNTSPEAKYGKSKQQVLEGNKDLIKNGTFAGLGAKHNTVSEVHVDDYIEFGELAMMINKRNLEKNSFATPRLENLRVSGDLDTGVTVLADLVVDYGSVLVDYDDGSTVYGANIVMKRDKATGEINYSKTYFVEK